MSQVIPIRLPSKHRAELSEEERRSPSYPRHINLYSVLIPLPRLAVLREQIEAHEAPANPDVVARVTAVLAGSLKMSSRDVVSDPKAFINALSRGITRSQLPAYVLWAAADEAIGGALEYVPTAKEFLDICAKHRQPYLTAIYYMEEEHRRREEEQKKRQDAEDKEARWLRQLYELMIEAGAGETIPDLVDTEFATRVCSFPRRDGIRTNWRELVTDPRAPALCCCLADIARAAGLEHGRSVIAKARWRDIDAAAAAALAEGGVDSGGAAQSVPAMPGHSLLADEPAPRRLSAVLAELEGWQLPGEDDPRLREELSRMGYAPAESSAEPQE